MSCDKSQPGKIFMYLSYLDDSGSDKESPLVVVGAILIPDAWFLNLEAMHGTIVEQLIPQDKLDEFTEFHAADLYGGHGVFKDIDQPKRFEAIRKLLGIVSGMKFSCVYSAVDKKQLSQTAYGGVNSIDVAFRMCALGVEQWLVKQSRQEIGILIMDETKENGLKHAFRNSFRSLRGRLRPPDWSAKRLLHVHDDMYFGDSKDSVGIQLIDLCAYFLLRKLRGNNESDEFYNIFSAQLECSKAEPEWTQMKGILKEHP